MHWTLGDESSGSLYDLEMLVKAMVSDDVYSHIHMHSKLRIPEFVWHANELAVLYSQ